MNCWRTRGLFALRRIVLLEMAIADLRTDTTAAEFDDERRGSCEAIAGRPRTALS